MSIGDPKQFSQITQHFSENGAKTPVNAAADVKDEINKLQTGHFDAVIGDLDLGRENGLCFIKRLKKISDTARFRYLLVNRLRRL